MEDGEDAKVHVEAVDESWWRRIREEKEKERREKMPVAMEEEDGAGTEEESKEEESKEVPLRLMVKARGKKDCKIRVTAVSISPIINLAILWLQNNVRANEDV